jgi:hypothetical protein
MDAASLLTELATKGISVRRTPDGKLGLKPRARLTPDLIERVQARKDELLAMLTVGANGEADRQAWRDVCRSGLLFAESSAACCQVHAAGLRTPDGRAWCWSRADPEYPSFGPTEEEYQRMLAQLRTWSESPRADMERQLAKRDGQ